MTWSNRKDYFLFIAIYIGLLACNPKKPTDANNPLLASVFSQNLYYADIQDLLPSSSPDDSLVAINNMVNRWIKNTLLMREAEKNIPPDLNIEQLVNDYRESLILHNYEQMLVEKNLDTLISDSELQQYYNATKSQYILEYTIVQCVYLKLPKNYEQSQKIKNLLRGNTPNIGELAALINQDDIEKRITSGVWYRALDILDLMPDNAARIRDLSKNKLFDIKDGDYQYLLKIIAKVPASREAPLSYIKDQIIRIILHERKINLLQNINDRLYERELQNNNIKIYSE